MPLPKLPRDCRGVYTPIRLPAWAKPGVTVPMPDYAGNWALKTGNPNFGRVHPGGKYARTATNRTEC